MDGMNRIIDRIQAEAQAEIDRTLNDAREEVAKITASYQAKASAERETLEARNRRLAAEHAERLESGAHIEGRKEILAAKQEVLQKVYAMALERLCSLPREEAIDVLATLLCEAAPDGQGEAIFSEKDREDVGRAAVSAANAVLAKQAAPELPAGLTEGKLGSMIGKIVANANAISQGTAQIRLSEETRPICGGFILRSGNVEINCAYDTLIRLQQEQTSAQVAKILFR